MNRKIESTVLSYPEDFKRRVVAAFSGCSADARARIQQHLDRGSEWVGRYLQDATHGTVPASQVLGFLDRGAEGIAVLRRHCDEQVKLEQLFIEWSDIAAAHQQEKTG